jgi:hypothetical protein
MEEKERFAICPRRPIELTACGNFDMGLYFFDESQDEREKKINESYIYYTLRS